MKQREREKEEQRRTDYDSPPWGIYPEEKKVTRTSVGKIEKGTENTKDLQFPFPLGNKKESKETETEGNEKQRRNIKEK